MAQGLFETDPLSSAENRSTAQQVAWDLALANNQRQPVVTQQTSPVDQQKALDFNAWVPQNSPQPQIITPPVAAPEPEPAADSGWESFLRAQGIDPATGLPADAVNQWGDTFQVGNEAPQGKPSGGLRNTIQNSGVGQAIGGGIGMMVGGPIGAAALGGTLGGVAGAISGGGAFGSGKGESQQQRDAWRREMQGLGFIDENYQIRLPNGTYFDMGKDGGARLANGLRYYETDVNNPVTEHVINMTRPLAAILTAGDEKLSADITAYLTNAAMQNGGTYEGARQAVVGMMRDLGIRKVETMVDELQQLRASGAITEEEFTLLNDNALALGKKNRDEAIRTATQSIAQQQAARAAAETAGQTLGEATGDETRKGASLLKTIPIAQQFKQQQQQSSTPSGMRMANVLQTLRSRQGIQGGGSDSEEKPEIRTYSNPRYKTG